MNVHDARESSLCAIEKKKKDLRFIWHCGLINKKIREATESGAYDAVIEYPPHHYVATNHELFEKVYRDEGYRVEFKPDYIYIKATKWILHIWW